MSGRFSLFRPICVTPGPLIARSKDRIVVVNLVGILRESGKQTFEQVHAEGAELIAKACNKRKIPLVHLSSIGADPESSSKYSASKGRGEELIRKAHRSAVILRSSIIFGNEDEFFNRFGRDGYPFTLPALDWAVARPNSNRFMSLMLPRQLLQRLKGNCHLAKSMSWAVLTFLPSASAWRRC